MENVYRDYMLFGWFKGNELKWSVISLYGLNERNQHVWGSYEELSYPVYCQEKRRGNGSIVKV
jgi:hypothetical protein